VSTRIAKAMHSGGGLLPEDPINGEVPSRRTTAANGLGCQFE